MTFKKMKIKPTIGLKISACILILFGLSGFYPVTYTPVTVKTIPKLLLLVSWCTVLVITGVGILYLKKWARISATTLIAIKTIQSFVGSATDLHKLINHSADSIVIFVGIGLIVCILTVGSLSIYFFSRPVIKRQFR